MTEVENILSVWEENGKAAASQLKERLKVLDAERSQIMDHLSRIEGKKYNGSKRKYTRSSINVRETTLTIVQEAGAAGISAPDVVTAVQAEAADETNKTTILTNLNRLKREGKIIASGIRGSFIYKAVEDAT